MSQSDVKYKASPHLQLQSEGTIGRLRMMELLYAKFYRKLYLYALTYLEDKEEARDVVSELFLQLWDKWEEEKDLTKQPSATLLYAMLRNRCIDLLRHRNVVGRYLQQLEQGRFNNDDDIREFEEAITLLSAAIQQLPEPEKTILNCCYFKRMTYQQTADALVISLPMVKKHMVKVFKLLRDKLKNDKDGRTTYMNSSFK